MPSPASVAAAARAKSAHSGDELQELAKAHLEKEQQQNADQESWSSIRLQLHSIIHHMGFEAFCALIIVLNMVLVVVETNATAAEEETPGWVEATTLVFLAFYTAELATKLFVYRIQFFKDRWNNMDFCVVGLDLILLLVGVIVDDMPSVAILRVFRLARLARAFKAASFFHELHALLRSFTCAIKAICWGLIMIALCLVIWGILAVQLLHPVNVSAMKNKPYIYDECERCPRAFSTVFNAMLTLFQQLVAGDEWGSVSTVIIEEAPWTAMFMLLVLMTVSLTMLNLILTVTLEAGASAAAEDDNANAVQIRKKIMQAEKKLIEICASLDKDQSGALNIEEFLEGFENHKEFQDALQVMNVNAADIHMIFNICDEDGSGDVNYHEFVEQLRRIKDSGEKMLLYYMTDVRHMVAGIKKNLGVPATKVEAAKQKRKDKNGRPIPRCQEDVEPEAKVDESQPKDRALPPVPEEGNAQREEKVNFDSVSSMFSQDRDALLAAINDSQQQLMTSLQGLATKIDTMAAFSAQGDQLAKLSNDISTMLQQSSSQTGLLNKISDDSGVLKASISNASRGCVPMFPFRSGPPGAAGDPTRSGNPDAACCDVRAV